jgi:hypothetical protein
MQKFNVDAPSSSSHGRTEIRRFGVRSIAPSPLDRPAGIASRPSMDDAGALRTDANRRLTKAEDEYASTTTTTHRRSVRGGDCADVEHAMEIALRRRIKRETARAYREALDEQIRARDAKFVGSAGARRFNTVGGHVPALGERAMNVVVDDDGWTSRVSTTTIAEAENEERRRQRDAYVAALDAQVAERRERARREKEAREKADREEDARIAAAIEEERAVLEEKRALMARSAAAASGENASSVSATSVRKPRVTHSPPASPRPSPRVPPIHVDDDDDVDEGYQPIPEFPDDDDDATTTDPSSTRELVAIIRELVVERGEMSRRLADAEARIARLQRRQQKDDDDDDNVDI